jgi:hypothetical protein
MTSMSTMGGNRSMTLAEFDQLLDVYGADRARWPAELRTAATQLVARDAGALRLLAEAEALDHVLERAPLPAPAVETALAARIVAAAQRSPRIVKLEESRPAALAAVSRAPVQAVALRAPARPGTRRGQLLSQRARALGFLAACLAIGVVLGDSDLTPQFLPELASMTGLAPDDSGLVQIALSDEVTQ